jgi:hypothetical protein
LLITKISSLRKSVQFSSTTDEIEFLKSDNMISVRSRMTEINGKNPFKFVQNSSIKGYSIRSSSLLENILKCNFDFSISYLESNEYQLILSVIDKLTNIEIVNGCLNIESKIL